MRQLSDGSYAHSGHGQYIRHPKYAADSAHFIRAFLAIDSDLQSMFEFIEPADANLAAYSLRLHALLMRVCIEIEANLRAIMSENCYRPQGLWSMADYRKVEGSHFLSRYQAKMPIWSGERNVYAPFATWREGGGLRWYQDYNDAKHDRHGSFQKASLSNVVKAYAALAIVLFAQFRDETFDGPDLLALESSEDADGFDYGTSSHILIKPADMPDEERYMFDWQSLRAEPDPFDNFAYQQ